MTILGCILIAIGLPCAYLSRRQLDKNWSPNPKVPFKLETTGFYRLRHPMYIFGGLWFAGMFVVSHYYKTGAVVMFLYTTVQSYRAGREDQLLAPMRRRGGD